MQAALKAGSHRAFSAMGWQSGLQLWEAERELGPRLGSEAWIPDSLLWCHVIVLLVKLSWITSAQSLFPEAEAGKSYGS